MGLARCVFVVAAAAAASAAAVEKKNEKRTMRLMRPQNLMVTQLFNDVPATANFSWPGARTAAQRGKALVYTYLNFEDDPPPVSYENVLEGNQNIIGLYTYFPGQPGEPPISESITIKNGLDSELEFYVAVHELLHFGGFGTTHGLPAATRAATESLFRSEFAGVAQGDPVVGAHWDSVSGTHIRTGKSAEAEVMTPSIGGDAFLAAATLKACTRKLKTANPGNYCISDDMCDGEYSVCMLGQSTTPGHCNGTHVDVEWPHTDGDDDAFLAIVISACVLVVFVMIGIMISWVETSYSVYDRLPPGKMNL